MKSWKKHNAIYEHHFWTDSAVRTLLRIYFPQHISDLYDQYPHDINRADMRKYILLYLVGGVYADLDTECIKQLDILNNYTGCVFSQEPELHKIFLYNKSKQSVYISSSFIACTAFHPLVRYVIDLLPKYASNAANLKWNDNILNSTGPTFLTEAVEQYIKQQDTNQSTVFISPAEWFVPTFDPINTQTFKVFCKTHISKFEKLSSNLSKVCDKIFSLQGSNKVTNSSYTTHHWLHSWATNFATKEVLSVDSFLNDAVLHV